MDSIAKRPKRGETEEDLLRQQKQFLSENKIQSKVTQNSEQIDELNGKHSKNNIADNHDLPKIVTKIVEKNVNNLDEFYELSDRTDTLFKQTSDGFPKAIRRRDNLMSNSGKSLFAQHMNINSPKISEVLNTNNSFKSKVNPKTETIICGNGLGINDWKSDINRIRNENQELIDKMDAKEIKEMQNELKSKLSQKTIEFLLNKKSKKFEYNIKIENKSNDREMSETIDEKYLPIKSNEVIENKWLNMNVIESDKLLWMRDIEQPSKELTKDHSTEPTISARFDFEANLIDNTNREIDVHSGLYHHQLEESSAGYTIQELYTLIQSKFSSQKVLGLQVLAKLLNKAYKGIFDLCFNESLVEQLIKNSALVLVTRVALDDTSETVWRVAINAMHALLCNTSVDELFLDRGFTFFSQCLTIEDNRIQNLKPSYDSTKLNELSDEQIMKLDVIHCLVSRTSLLQRIRYLFEFNKSQLDSKSVNDLLDILIRIGRHSDSKTSIIECPYLLGTIVKTFIPVSVVMRDSVFDKPNPKALKLIRLLTTNDLQTTLEILNTFPQLIEAIKVYLTLNPENCGNSEEILELSIESLRIWITLLSQNQCIDDFWQMFPIVIKQLQYCLTLDPIRHKNSFDFQYASTLIFLIKILVKHRPEFNTFNDLVLMIAMKWFVLVKNTVIVPNFDANLCLLSVVEFLLMTNFNVQSLQEIISQIIDSQTFSTKFVNQLNQNSNLIHLNTELRGNRRDSSNLPSFGSISFGGLQTTHFMNNESPICLFLAIIRVMKTSSNDRILNRLDCIKDYPLNIIRNIKYNTKFNLFDCYELNLLAELCLFCSSVPSVCVDSIYSYLNLSILILSFIKNNSIKRNLLDRVVFNQSIHCFGIIEKMAELSLEEDFNPNAIKESFNAINTLYKKYSDFCGIYWPFDPLIDGVKNKTTTNQEVYDCLTFICLLIKNHSNYFKQLMSSSSVLFCLISSVFLISEEVFFDNSVQKLLNFLLKKLISDGINCRIEDRVPFFETTGDFFVKFMEQFESSSYGNKLFINYLLVFCQTKSSSLFRTKLFTEYLTALRIINIRIEEILIPIENFLFPIETDVQTLESYIKSLLCGALTPKESPVLYLIAIHHLNHQLFGSTQENNKFDRLIRSVHNSNNELLKQHLLLYSHFDPKLLYGISLKPN